MNPLQMDTNSTRLLLRLEENTPILKYRSKMSCEKEGIIIRGRVLGRNEKSNKFWVKVRREEAEKGGKKKKKEENDYE